MFEEKDEWKAKEYMERAIDKDKKFNKFFREAVVEFDKTIMALIVDAYLENYMWEKGIVEITKKRGSSDLERVYEGEEEEIIFNG